MRVFLDANILFSAAKSDGAVRALLPLLDENGHECHADAYVIEEARRNLVAKAPARLAALERLLTRTGTAGAHRVDDELESRLPLPAKDRPVLAAAIHLDCDALVTGDRTHFGKLYGRTILGVTIHSPRSLAEAILSGG
jgi:predicted nucleic acid-binding protein